MTRIPWRSGYCGKVISLGPIAHWPLYDLSGTVARNSMNTFNTILDGAYTGVTLQQTGIGDGFNSVLFDGLTNFCNVYSVGLNSLFNGAEGSLSGWLAPTAVSLTDGGTRYAVIIGANASTDYIFFSKGTANNTFTMGRKASNVTKSITATNASSAFAHWVVTWSVSADQVKVYLNASQQGSTLTTLSAFSGALGSSSCVIGAVNLTPSLAWSGNIAHIALWNRVLTPAEITSLATVP